MKKSAVNKYLKNYAEPEISSLFPIEQKWDEVIVIPAHNEYDELLEVLNYSVPRISSARKVLLILVVNGGEDSADHVHQTNLKLLTYMQNKTSFKPSELLNLDRFNNFDLLLVNRATTDRLFNKKSGVGLARKIGSDLALALIESGNIASKWIRGTDADVILPDDYLDINPDPDIYSAITYPFYHEELLENNLGRALQLYETYLRYYYLGLVWAGSPYAFHTIGSSMAVSAEAYAQVRGFPGKREAAEDFYMLNKLAKIAPVFRSISATIRIRGRESDRVPFGTGAAMYKINNRLNEGQEYNIYHPQIFYFLKQWYTIIDRFIEVRDFEKLAGLLNAGEKVIMEGMEQLGAEAALKNAAAQSDNPQMVRRHIHTWFDGFRTLRFIHIFSTGPFQPLNWQQALQESAFVDFKHLAGLAVDEIRKEMFDIEMKITGQYHKSILTI